MWKETALKNVTLTPIIPIIGYQKIREKLLRKVCLSFLFA